MGMAIALEEVMKLAKQLSPRDKLRLIERLAPQIGRDLESSPGRPRKSLRGLWNGLDVTDEDISEARREMWSSFPREDI